MDLNEVCLRRLWGCGRLFLVYGPWRNLYSAIAQVQKEQEQTTAINLLNVRIDALADGPNEQKKVIDALNESQKKAMIDGYSKSPEQAIQFGTSVYSGMFHCIAHRIMDYSKLLAPISSHEHHNTGREKKFVRALCRTTTNCVARRIATC
eukprot:TRINITY_DN6760_c0_g3_i2.p1 TRINITY_DN6760_c0_g3~~TRINITY_DN6760_c0_g3_i2.p1  ORF type:complete len:150 (+),score=22.45 TRINITY_DN6760_c0_g3_i2:118-567(+)